MMVRVWIMASSLDHDPTLTTDGKKGVAMEEEYIALYRQEPIP